MYAILHAEPYIPFRHWDHVLCGPWTTAGCGPPLAALIVVHGFWLTMTAGLTVLAISTCSPVTLRGVGLSLIAAGICGMVGLAIWEMATMIDAVRPYAVERYFFLMATLVDVPIIPATLAGLACWTAGRRKTQNARLIATQSPADARQTP
jgi:hypothetical protein